MVGLRGSLSKNALSCVVKQAQQSAGEGKAQDLGARWYPFKETRLSQLLPLLWSSLFSHGDAPGALQQNGGGQQRRHTPAPQPSRHAGGTPSHPPTPPSAALQLQGRAGPVSSRNPTPDPVSKLREGTLNPALAQVHMRRETNPTVETTPSDCAANPP